MGREIDSALVDDGGAMYVSERKIYPRDVDGRFQINWPELASSA